MRGESMRERLIPAMLMVRVDGHTVQLVDIRQERVRDDQYITMLYVRGHIHSNSAYMVLEDMPCEALNRHVAYLTDADVIGHTDGGELQFEYELTVRDRVPRIIL